MTTFFTADLHLGHKNILDYCHRPWPDLAAMNEGLVEQWNEVVTEADEVYILGDLTLGSPARTFPYVERLNGVKWLVPGNHDICWPHYSRAKAARYAAVGVEVLGHDAYSVRLDATLCHFPYDGDHADMDRFLPYRPADYGGWLLHGHVHDAWKVRGRQINVGVDVWDYRPVPDSTLAAIMAGMVFGDGEQ